MERIIAVREKYPRATIAPLGSRDTADLE